MPAPVRKSPSELQSQENEVYKALRAWYTIPGIQRELRHKENEAVQTVLEVFESRKRNRKASGAYTLTLPPLLVRGPRRLPVAARQAVRRRVGAGVPARFPRYPGLHRAVW